MRIMPTVFRCLALGVTLSLISLPLTKASEFGGPEDARVEISPELQNALKRGLEYLASRQNEDGSWGSEYGKNVGEVSLALMGFMAMGNLPGEGEYGSTVAKGVNWILAQSQPNGLIQYTKQAKQGPVMYGHALATLMLSEAWGQTRRKDIGNTLRKAVDLIVRVQGPKGGWNYRSVPKDGDTSVCVMQMLALKSAHEAGIYVPKMTIDKALDLIKKRYDAKERGYGYSNDRFNDRHAGSSAAGTCIMYITDTKEEKLTIVPLTRLIEDMEKNKVKAGHKFYLAYYMAISAYADGEKTFKRCMKAMEPFLLKSQEKNGSWDRGSIHKTGFAILAGALPFRYLPIYQRSVASYD